MATPSTHWREIISPDEDARYARQGEMLARLQHEKSARYGSGRALHRKPVLAVRGWIEIADGLPEPARSGVFAVPGRYPVLVRFSNGGTDVRSNRAPDIRGVALRIEGLQGEAALGGTTDHQDFLFINHDAFASASSDEFMAVVEAASRGPWALVLMLLRQHGLGGALSRLKRLGSTLKKPFSGFATERFNTCLPVAVGAYAARVLLQPEASDAALDPDPALDMTARLARGTVEYGLELQFFTSEADTPIENPTVVWSAAASPPVRVAHVVLTDVVQDEVQNVETLRFDPWGGLMAHRPLGEIMRARKAAYFVSQQGRGAA